MDKDYKTMIEDLGWEITQEIDRTGRILYTSTKGPKIAMSHDLYKLYHGCKFMETVDVNDVKNMPLKEFSEKLNKEMTIDPFKDLPVKEPPVTEKKKKMLDYFKFKLDEKNETYVNEKVKIGIDVTDVNTLSDQRLFKTLDILTQADKVTEETFIQLLQDLNNGR